MRWLVTISKSCIDYYKVMYFVNLLHYVVYYEFLVLCMYVHIVKSFSNNYYWAYQSHRKCPKNAISQHQFLNFACWLSFPQTKQVNHRHHKLKPVIPAWPLKFWWLWPWQPMFTWSSYIFLLTVLRTYHHDSVNNCSC